MKNAVSRRERLKMVGKHGNSDAAHARKVLPFSVTKEPGLENYLLYSCTRFRENWRKTAPARVVERENFVTAEEVGRCACVLN